MDAVNKAELARLSQVIGLIYEGATDPARWSRDIVPATADYLGAPGANLFTASRRLQDGGFCFYRGVTQDRIDLFMGQYLPDNPWARAAAAKGLITSGNVILGQELLTTEEWLSSRLFTECLGRPRIAEQMMAGVIFGMESQDAMGTVYAVYRSLDDPLFDEEDRAKMQLLLPHISRSLGVMDRLRSAELTVATTLAALDRLATGAVLLDGGGRVGFANQAAQRMLERGDGLHLRKASREAGLGELDAHEPRLSRAIGSAIDGTLRHDPYDTPHFSRAVVVPQRSGHGNYTLQFSALGGQNEFGGGRSGYAAIVFIADDGRKPVIDPQALRSAYGLTPAEARVAIATVDHVSAKDVARVLGVSPHTVRSQIQRVYAKLGVDTRARFVKVMLGLAGPAA
jgi:DNA-binding CsgD family transcriptional regulator